MPCRFRRVGSAPTPNSCPDEEVVFSLTGPIGAAAAATAGLTMVSAAPPGDAVPASRRPYYAQSISWPTCPEDEVGNEIQGIECAEVTVPMDYSHPDGERIQIEISRKWAGTQDIAAASC